MKFADTIPSLKNTPIPTETLADIGRLIRACAELEDCIKHYICLLADMSERNATIILGTTATRKRFEIAEELARVTGEAEHDLFSKLAGQLKDVIETRNSVAHGVYLGQNEKDGRLFFRIERPVKNDLREVIVLVAGVLPDDIKRQAARLEALIPEIEKHLRIEALREKRLQQTPQLHPKASRKPHTERKRGGPPRSSRG